MNPLMGIDHVAINVRDIDQALEFYTRVFGLKVTDREPSKPGIEYFLDCGPSLIGIIQAKDFELSHPFQNEGLGANHFSFRVHASQFDQIIKHLHDNNVKIEFAKKREKSWSLYCYDLDGNKVEVTAWPREDGVREEYLQPVRYDPESKQWTPC